MTDNFIFNFSLDDSCRTDKRSKNKEEASPERPLSLNEHSIPNARSSLAKQVPILPFHKEIVELLWRTASMYSIPGTRTKLKYIGGQQAHDILTTTHIGTEHAGMELETLLKLSDSKHSDLIPGVYEGGLKIWECAFDLVEYILESDLELSGKRVLELGCGVGLPGICSLMKGADNVVFQDYNSEVLTYVTIPNVMLNAENGNQVEKKCKFYSGDWSSIPTILDPMKYDVILTSETIYSIDSQPKLLSVLKEMSSLITGVVLVAAKSFYFGVGGGVDSFCCLVDEDGTFSVCDCIRIEASVPRIILKLTHRT